MLKYCLKQSAVCVQTGDFGANMRSAVVPEPYYRPDRAQTLLLPMAVTIVRVSRKNNQPVQ